MQSHDRSRSGSGGAPSQHGRGGAAEKPRGSYVEGGWMDENGQFFPHHGLQGGVETWINKGS